MDIIYTGLVYCKSVRLGGIWRRCITKTISWSDILGEKIPVSGNGDATNNK